jgi:hypothetical protein
MELSIPMPLHYSGNDPTIPATYSPINSHKYFNWRRLCNEQLHNLQPSTIIRVTESRRMDGQTIQHAWER